MGAGGQSLNIADRSAGAESGDDKILAVRGVSKHFGGTQALNDVGMDVGAGEIVALLGENGAGKSTLIKILASVYSLDDGHGDLSRPRRDGDRSGVCRSPSSTRTSA